MSNCANSVTNCYNSAFVSPEQAERLTWREAQLLDYLASHAGRFVPADELADAILGEFRADHAVRVWVHRIRAKLGAETIESAAGLGYRVSLSRADALAWRCGRCGRAVVHYAEQWVCHGCGAMGRRPRDIDPLPDDQWECAFCGVVFQRPRGAVEYEQARRPGARTFCSLECARRASKRRRAT